MPNLTYITKKWGSLQGGRLIFEGIYHFIFVHCQPRDMERTCSICLQLSKLWIIDNIKTFRLVHKGHQQIFYVRHMLD
jgi:hypothetical protein